MQTGYFLSAIRAFALTKTHWLLTACLLLSGAARAATLTVTTLADSGAGSLRDQLAAAASGDTIDFSVTGTITLTSGELGVSENLTITGPGASALSLSGNNTTRVFNLANGNFNLAISGLTIANGRNRGADAVQTPMTDATAGFGGGIYNQSSGTVTLADCVVSGCSAVGGNGATIQGGHGRGAFGGAIYHTGSGTLIITRTVFTGNSASAGNNDNDGFSSALGGGAGIYNAGAGSVQITDSTFTGNVANGAGTFGAGSGTDGRGGAIYNATNGTVTLLRTTLNANSATGASGNINGGAGLGGAIFVGNGILNLTNCTLANNHASGGNSGGGGVAGGAGNGGALHHAGSGTVNLLHCTISLNTANGGLTSYTGGRIKGKGAGLANAGTGTITVGNTLCAGDLSNTNNEDVNGAFISAGHNLIGNGTNSTGFAAAGDQVGMTGAPLNSQLAALANNGGFTLTMALLPNSPAINAGDNAQLAGLATDQRGAARVQLGVVDIGAVEMSLADWGITPVTVADGAIWYLGAPAFGADLTVYRQAGNSAPVWVDGGSGERLGQANDGTILVENSGGGVYARPGSTNGLGTGWLQLMSVTAGDAATWFLGPDGVGADHFIYRWVAGGTPTYTGGYGTNLFTTATGAVRTFNSQGNLYERLGSQSSLGTGWQQIEIQSFVVTTTNDVVTTADLQTSLREAVAYAATLGGTNTITFSSSTANGAVNFFDGMAHTIALNGTQITLASSVNITGPGTNRLTLSGNNSSRIFQVVGGNSVNFSGMTLTAGRDTDGGAIYNDGALTVSNVNFTDNSANTNNGIGGAITSNGSLSVAGAIFYHNSAFLGGAINSSDGLSVVDTTFSTGHASFNGGALRLFGNSQITRTTFSNNQADNGGGALINHGVLGLANCTLANNVALDGGGLQAWVGSLNLTNVTIAYNTANNSGGGISLVGGTATVHNSIIAANNATGLPADITGNINVTTDSRNNLVGLGSNSGITNGVNGNLVQHFVIRTNLAFNTFTTNLVPSLASLSPLANNGGPTATIGLLSGSAAIGAGAIDLQVLTDQRGVARDSAPDIGAYEYQYPVQLPGSNRLRVDPVDGANLRVTYKGAVNAQFILQKTDSLTPVNWADVALLTTGGDGSVTYVIAKAPGTNMLFFRFKFAP